MWILLLVLGVAVGVAALMVLEEPFYRWLLKVANGQPMQGAVVAFVLYAGLGLSWLVVAPVASSLDGAGIVMATVWALVHVAMSALFFPARTVHPVKGQLADLMRLGATTEMARAITWTAMPVSLASVFAGALAYIPLVA